MGEDSHSNCSNSGISGQTKGHKDHGSHARRAPQYGTYLESGYESEYRKPTMIDDTPLNQDDIVNINKRVRKALDRIQQREAELTSIHFKGNDGSYQNSINENDENQNDLGKIRNLCGFKLAILSSNIFD
jgi:hypothetical protein